MTQYTHDFTDIFARAEAKPGICLSKVNKFKEEYSVTIKVNMAEHKQECGDCSRAVVR